MEQCLLSGNADSCDTKVLRRIPKSAQAPASLDVEASGKNKSSHTPRSSGAAATLTWHHPTGKPAPIRVASRKLACSHLPTTTRMSQHTMQRRMRRGRPSLHRSTCVGPCRRATSCACQRNLSRQESRVGPTARSMWFLVNPSTKLRSRRTARHAEVVQPRVPSNRQGSRH